LFEAFTSIRAVGAAVVLAGVVVAQLATLPESRPTPSGVPTDAFRVPTDAFRVPTDAFRVPTDAFRVPTDRPRGVWSG
jgi:hypothetical protein